MTEAHRVALGLGLLAALLLPSAAGNAADPLPGLSCEEALQRAELDPEPLSASLQLQALLQAEACAPQWPWARTRLGAALLDLDLPSSAQRSLLPVLDESPDDPSVSEALSLLLRVSERTGDRLPLRERVLRVPPELWPRAERSELYYLAGRELFDQGEHGEARRYFGQVAGPRQPFADYVEGVIYARQRRLKSAVRRFRDVVAATEGGLEPLDPGEVRRLHDLALLDIGRIYYSVRQFAEASRTFARVQEDSPLWPEARFEAAWASFMQSEPGETLALLDGLEDQVTPPRRRGRRQSRGRQEEIRGEPWLPEAPTLRSATLFGLCRYTEAEALARADQEALGLQLASLDEAARSEDRWKSLNELEPALVRSLRQDALLDGIGLHLEQLDREQARLRALEPGWYGSLGRALDRGLDLERGHLAAQADTRALRGILRETDRLERLVYQQEILRFEVQQARLDFWPTEELCREEGACVAWDRSGPEASCLREAPLSSCCY